MTIDKQLLESLPEEITLAGISIHRRVYLDGEYLNPEDSRKVINKSVTLDWGYRGSGPHQFALALLLKFLPEKEALLLYQAMVITVIAGLSAEADFHIKFQMRGFLLALSGYADKPRKPSHFIEHLPIDQELIHTLGYSARPGYDEIQTTINKVKVVDVEKGIITDGKGNNIIL